MPPQGVVSYSARSPSVAMYLANHNLTTFSLLNTSLKSHHPKMCPTYNRTLWCLGLNIDQW